VRPADLILTAEQDHVIRIAAIDPGAFARTMTLPEFVTAASRSLPDREDAIDWVHRLTAARTAQAYLGARIGEVADPTGSSARAFEAAVVALEAQCSMVASMLSRALEPAR
jgi:protein-tyrosine-phosphatase